MKREIIFRAKDIEDGNWQCGYYLKRPNPRSRDGLPFTHHISDLPPFGYAVDVDTLGQYTGLKDKSGRMIFEGDIVTFNHFGDKKTGKVKFNVRMSCMELGVTSSDGHYNSYFLGHCENMKVVGNIYDD